MAPNFLEQLISAAGCGFFLVDDGGKVLLANPWFVEKTGLDEKTCADRELYDLLPHWKGGHLQLMLDDALETGQARYIQGESLIDWFPGSPETNRIPGLYRLVFQPVRRGEGTACLIQIFLAHGLEEVMNFIGHAPWPMLMAREGRLIFANPAGFDLLGFPADQPIEHVVLTDLVVKGERRRLSELVDRAEREPAFVMEEIRLRHSSGRPVHVELMIGPLRGHDCVRLVLIPRDLSGIKQVESGLRASEWKYQAMIDSTSEGFWVLNAKLEIVEVNQALCRMLKIEADKLIGRCVLQLMPEMFHEIVRPPLSGADQQNQCRLELALLGEGDHKIHCVVSATVLRNEVDELTGSFAFVTDVTPLIEAETQMHLAAKVFETTSEAIFVTDAHNRLEAINPAFTAVTGYDADEVVGMRPQFLFADRHAPSFFEPIWLALRAGGKWEGEIWFRRKNGVHFPAWASLVSVENPTHPEGLQYVAVFADITKRNEAEEIIRRQANFDSLTDLPNRVLFMDRLSNAMKMARRNSCQVAVMFIDLDRFKLVNDTLGHGIGDLLLKDAARRLEVCARDSDTVARLGGDEFTVILPDLKQARHAEIVADKILKQLAQPFYIDGHELFISGSIGITIFPHDGDTIRDLLKHADTAMYQAKEAGRNSYRFFTQAMNAAAEERMRLEHDLRRSLDLGELRLYYQPILDTQTAKIVGCEALLRWVHPVREIVPPGNFISLAEETGLIIPIGDWVLRTACIQAQAWHERGMDLHISVNLSTRQFRQHDFRKTIEAALHESGLNPRHLVLEITESLMLEETEQLMQDLRILTQRGIRFSVDDFGTGYSSLSYLRRFPARILKIERNFLSHVHHRSDDAALVEAMVSLAHKLHMKVVAEGVEKVEQWEFLKSCGCDYLQGFYFSRPVPAEQFEDFVRENLKD
ncbi:EAL domain-containing protein [Sulfidibacter corallicola]|uniref:EAL domain-containing protein n=1 Tax=Sulfidibacter corallicola TaxID=2818388 RepID=A0A8A4U1X4_SULCO|nr:EAL domain-containing protein [Sulfidibacter corallicola]QTD52735.1 EAL domain-containing protein [Sulfidibacter corallicola]